MRNGRASIWSQDDDQFLIETLAEFNKQGKSAIEAFKHVASKLHMEHKKVSNRWYMHLKQDFEDVVGVFSQGNGINVWTDEDNAYVLERIPQIKASGYSLEKSFELCGQELTEKTGKTRSMTGVRGQYYKLIKESKRDELSEVVQEIIDTEKQEGDLSDNTEVVLEATSQEVIATTNEVESQFPVVNDEPTFVGAMDAFNTLKHYLMSAKGMSNQNDQLMSKLFKSEERNKELQTQLAEQKRYYEGRIREVEEAYALLQQNYRDMARIIDMSRKVLMEEQLGSNFSNGVTLKADRNGNLEKLG